MKTTSVQSAGKTIKNLVANNIPHPLFLWGPPGIGKSSIVQGVAKELEIGFVDLRISQLAPTDIRGIPFVDKENLTAKFARPEFYPTEGRGILFLDEMNMATPIMMGICQQLVLDRRVGEHVIPEGWTIIAAGNRTEDRAAVSAMPSPVANRFIHLDVEVNFEEWKRWALGTEKFPEQIISFLNFKPQLLMQPSKTQMTWPSPRSWQMAANLFNIGEEIISAVGPGPDSEFRAFIKLYSKLPEIEKILEGQGDGINSPTDPSILYAMVGSFYSRATDVKHFVNATKWMLEKKVSEDFLACFLKDSVVVMTNKNMLGPYTEALRNYPDYRRLIKFIKEAMA